MHSGTHGVLLFCCYVVLLLFEEELKSYPEGTAGMKVSRHYIFTAQQSNGALQIDSNFVFKLQTWHTIFKLATHVGVSFNDGISTMSFSLPPFPAYLRT